MQVASWGRGETKKLRKVLGGWSRLQVLILKELLFALPETKDGNPHGKVRDLTGSGTRLADLEIGHYTNKRRAAK